MEFSSFLARAAELITDQDILDSKGRMFGLDESTLWAVIPQLFNILLLFTLMTILLYKPVRNALQARTERIEKQLADAEQELAKATELRESYEKKMGEAARERDEILAEARRAAQEVSNKLINDAKKEAETIKERAAANVEMEWERAESDMRAAIIDVSAVMAEKFVRLAINKETHDQLFDETMKDLEGMTWRD